MAAPIRLCILNYFLKHKLYYPPALEDLKVISHTEERLKSQCPTQIWCMWFDKRQYMLLILFLTCNWDAKYTLSIVVCCKWFRGESSHHRYSVSSNNSNHPFTIAKQHMQRLQKEKKGQKEFKEWTSCLMAFLAG